MPLSPRRFRRIISLLSCVILPAVVTAQEDASTRTLDDSVRAFLEDHKGEWRDLNIPTHDGELLYDIIVENSYTRALEIGTSTGHSATGLAEGPGNPDGGMAGRRADLERTRVAIFDYDIIE